MILTWNCCTYFLDFGFIVKMFWICLKEHHIFYSLEPNFHCIYLVYAQFLLCIQVVMCSYKHDNINESVWWWLVGRWRQPPWLPMPTSNIHKINANRMRDRSERRNVALLPLNWNFVTLISMTEIQYLMSSLYIKNWHKSIGDWNSVPNNIPF